MTAQGVQAFVASEAEPLHAGIPPRPQADGHWIEVLFDRMDQLEFTLSDETGVQGELLQAMGEIGSQLDAVLARMDAFAPVHLPPIEPHRGPETDNADLAAADELLTTALSPLHDNLGRLSLLVQRIAARQDEIADAISDRIDQLESRLANLPERASRPNTTDLGDQIMGRLDRIESAVSAFEAPHDMASLIDAVESRIGDLFDSGLTSILAALPTPGAPNPDRDSLRRATAALEAVTSLASDSTATARLTTLVEGIAAQLMPQGTAAGAASDPGDLVTRLAGLLDARNAVLAARIDDLSHAVAAVTSQDLVHRTPSSLMTALAAHARTVTVPDDETTLPQASTELPADLSSDIDVLLAEMPLVAAIAEEADRPSPDLAFTGNIVDQQAADTETLPQSEERAAIEVHRTI